MRAYPALRGLAASDAPGVAAESVLDTCVALRRRRAAKQDPHMPSQSLLNSTPAAFRAPPNDPQLRELAGIHPSLQFARRNAGGSGCTVCAHPADKLGSDIPGQPNPTGGC